MQGKSLPVFTSLAISNEKVSHLPILFLNGVSMNCSDIYLRLTASLIPLSYKSPAGKLYVGVLSVLQSIFTNCISESLPSACFQTVLILDKLANCIRMKQQIIVNAKRHFQASTGRNFSFKFPSFFPYFKAL